MHIIQNLETSKMTISIATDKWLWDITEMENFTAVFCFFFLNKRRTIPGNNNVEDSHINCVEQKKSDTC